MSGVILSTPTPAIDIIGWESGAHLSGDVALAFPAVSLSIGEQSIVLALPAPVLAVTGTAGATASVAFSLDPAFGITGLVGAGGAVALPLPAGPYIGISGMTGVLGAVALNTPAVRVAASSPNMVAVSAPAVQVTVSGTTGIAGGVNLLGVTPALGVSGNVPYVANASLAVIPQVRVSGSTGQSCAVTLGLRALALATAGHTGVVGSVAMSLPVYRIDATGYEDHIGSVVLTIPMLVMQQTGRQAEGTTYSVVAMHTESSALSTYSNFKFNSFAQFNGVYLGANDAGVFALTGATDDGAAIAASARLGVTDFSTSHQKRVDRCYVGYRTDGSMVLRVTTDEQKVRDYLLAATGKTGIHGNHVRIGKGLAARYWQFEIMNKDGADFELDMLELKPTPLRRRVGGGDA